MAKSLVVTMDGCNNMEREYAFYRFREDGHVVDFASADGGEVTDDRGIDYDTKPIDACSVEDYDAVVLPTGWRVAEADTMILDWLDAYLTNVDAGVLGLSGTAVELLHGLDAVVLSERTVTAPPEVRCTLQESGTTVQDELVTVDGRLVTAQNTSALPFFIVAVRSNAAIPQALAHRAHERASWGDKTPGNKAGSDPTSFN